MAFKVVVTLEKFSNNATSNGQFLELYQTWLLEKGQVRVESKRLIFPGAELTRLHLNTLYEADQEVYAEFFLPEAGKEAGLDLRYAEEQCYSLVIKNSSEVAICKEVKEARTELLKISGLSLENKDTFGLAAEGNKLTAWRQPKTEGAAVELGMVEDSSIEQSGQAGLFTNNTKTKIDEFGAGSLHEAAPTIIKPEERGGRAFSELTPVVVTGTNLNNVIATNLHPGLHIVKNSRTEWEIVGTPEEIGNKPITLEPINSIGAAGATTTFTIKVSSPAEIAPTIKKPVDQTSTTGTAIPTIKIQGTTMVTLIASELPAGLVLTKVSPSEWTITGTPTTPKSPVTVTLKAKNTEPGEFTTTFKWTIVGAADPGGIYKFRTTAEEPIRLISVGLAGVEINAVLSPTQAYGTNSPEVAWVLGNSTSRIVSW